MTWALATLSLVGVVLNIRKRRECFLWSNPGESVFTPFMGVGSEVYVPVRLGRRGIGVELKPSYYRQALRNLDSVDEPEVEQPDFGLIDSDESEVA